MRIYEYARARSLDPGVVHLVVVDRLTPDRAADLATWEPDLEHPLTLDDLAVLRRHGSWISTSSPIPDQVIPVLDRLLEDPAVVAGLQERVAAERSRLLRLVEMEDHGVLVRIPEAADATKVAQQTLRVWMTRGRLPYYVLGDGKRYVFTGDVFMLANRGVIPDRVDGAIT